MDYGVKLPINNESGYFEIRLESIGGLGANLSGKLLGELGAIYLGLNSSSFSSYGSEKRGSPVKSYIRWCRRERELRLNSPVVHPNMLGIFHENIIGKENVMAGVTADTTVIVNTDQPLEKIRHKLSMYAGELCLVDALSIAMETKSRVNMVMLGAITKASGFIPLDAVKMLIQEVLGKKYPAMLEKNLEGIQKGYDCCKITKLEAAEQYRQKDFSPPKSHWGYETAPLGGMVTLFGNTVSNDISGSREGYIPLFIPEKCINCGLCDTTCPDMVFQFTKGEYKGRPSMINRGLDYLHCKGCLRCVEVCPTGALEMAKERDHDVHKMAIPNKDLIRHDFMMNDVGPNSWVTSESFSMEKKVTEEEEHA